MATLLLQAAGSFLGGAFGAAGAAIGSAVGATAGYLVDRALIDGTRHIEGPRLATPRPFTAEDGAPLPRVYGTARVGGTLIWATRFEEAATSKRQGFKGGAKVTSYSYFANAAFALCEGEIAGVRRIWADGREIDRTLYDIRVYLGGEEELPDPLVEAKQGSGNAPAYRGTAYAVLDRFPLGDYGNRIPQFQFEVMRPVGAFNRHVRAVTLIPGATEYGLEPAPVTYEPQPGETVAVNRHTLAAASDLAASLDELQALCPNLEHVALVAAWFGDDLRAGECRIRPMVTQGDPAGLSQGWIVSGVAREGAAVVSRHAGEAAYGGTPSDRSVMDAIAEIRARGLKVTLYPFVMMDVPAGNVLPDPYGGAAQAPYPWRGRITVAPAPGRPGSPDGSAAARAAVAAFCGQAQPAHFAAGADTVAFSGPAGDWGYRRLVLHYARLATLAGGVDAFLLGSEMRGLTTLRDGAGTFPFVEALAALAGEVRAVLGAGTKITYGADWSEYSGYHPQDGSGDVFFHLDALWAHPAVDAVGIDNYMPLSDWRDGDHAGGNPDGFAGPYDPEGLRAGIAGGEGFDWYYASDGDRRDRRRLPIADGAYGKPWTFRAKDLAGWWSNPHHERVDGVEKPAPTAWVPQSKPIWFTELGCPAVDKGPNRPNVFPDPKSSESAAPWFSGGGRSDLAQRRFLEAHQRHWDPAAEGFRAAGNPLSPVYGGCMVEASRIYLWSWDARPFPAFPLMRDVWGDGGNWSLGHWLNGRLSGVAVSDLIEAVLAEHGLADVDARHADGFLAGYVVADPSPARAALEPLMRLFGLSAVEENGRLAFTVTGAGATAPRLIGEVALEEGLPALERRREPDHALPESLRLSFVEALRDYQQGEVRAFRAGAAGNREEALAAPAVMEAGLAEALAADALRAAWSGREEVAFALPAAADGPAPGDVVRLAEEGADHVVTAVEEGLVRRVSARRIARVATHPWRTDLPLRDRAGVAPAGKPLVHFLDLPLAAAGAPESRFCAVAWARPWRSQAIFASPEESGFALRGTLELPGTAGSLAAPLGEGFEGRIDPAGTLLVRLFDGELESVSMAHLLNGSNAAAVRSASGAWEVLQFLTAEETAPSLWRLGGLLRGQLGTGDAMAAGAPEGAAFVLLDERVKPAGLQPAEIGLVLNWRAGPVGQDFSGPTFVRFAGEGGVRSLLPLAPVHLKARRAANGDLALGWVRRGRVDADGWAAADIPLGEASEAYRVDIAAAGGAPVRSETVTVPAITYAAAAMLADFGTPPAALDVTVRQMSAAIGPGLPAFLTVPLS